MTRLGILSSFLFILLWVVSNLQNFSPEKPHSITPESNPKNATALQFFQNSPEAGKAWTARFEKIKFLETNEPDWIIRSAPGGVDLIDKRANGNFIHHILDAIDTLRFKEKAANGPLEAFGLNPPYFAFKWGTPQKESELSLGSGSFVKRGDSESVTIGDGALFPLLRHAQDFNYWRLNKLLTFRMDEIDEIEVKVRTQGHQSPLLLAEREGVQWVNKKTLKRELSVENLVHQLDDLSIIQFFDDPSKTEEIRKTFDQKKTFMILLTPRKGAVKKLTLLLDQNRVIAQLSERGDAVFEVPMLLFFNARRKAAPIHQRTH